MALMYVTEFAGLGTADAGGPVQAAGCPPLVEQTPVAIGAGSLPSQPFSIHTTIVRIHVDVIASVNVGGTVATVNSGRMIAGQTEYFRVSHGQCAYVIANT